AGDISLQLIGNATFVSTGSVSYESDTVTELTNEATPEQAQYQELVKEVKEFLKTTE
ncbi:diaminopimelate epimerase, partial [Listeria monocytogenes]|nr:diaminopimelate epimerase [Listeria monocytogenes]